MWGGHGGPGGYGAAIRSADVAFGTSIAAQEEAGPARVDAQQGQSPGPTSNSLVARVSVALLKGVICSISVKTPLTCGRHAPHVSVHGPAGATRLSKPALATWGTCLRHAA